jgi:hypothetical protein
MRRLFQPEATAMLVDAIRSLKAQNDELRVASRRWKPIAARLCRESGV